MLKLNGIFPPLPSSFDSNEDLSTKKMCNNIRILCRYEITGVLILGSNGELINLSEKEKLEVYENTRVAIPSDRIMLAGTGGQSTRETIRLTKAAANSGADAALVLNPSYYRGLMTKEALTAHYHSVADASDIPIIVYNMPANSGLDMNADTIISISMHDNIIGMKDSGGNIVKMGDIRNRVKPEFQILAGSASFLLPALSVGASGGILALANIAPEQCLSILKAFNSGDMDAAKISQLKIIEANTAITARWGVPALKYAMDYLGLYGGEARRPIMPINSEIKDKLIDILHTSGIEELQ